MGVVYGFINFKSSIMRHY